MAVVVDGTLDALEGGVGADGALLQALGTLVGVGVDVEARGALGLTRHGGWQIEVARHAAGAQVGGDALQTGLLAGQTPAAVGVVVADGALLDTVFRGQ